MATHFLVNAIVCPITYCLPITGNSLRVLKAEVAFNKNSEKASISLEQITYELGYSEVFKKVILCVKGALWMFYFFTFLGPHTVLLGILIDILLESYCLKILQKMKTSK